MDRKDTQLQRVFHAVVLGAVVVACIIFARPVLMPLAFGIVFAFAIAPVVKKLEQWRVPTVVAVSVVVGGIGLVAVGVALQVGQQFATLLHELPTYTGTLKNKISSLGLTQNSTFDGLWKMYDEVSSAIQQQTGTGGSEQETVFVREAASNGWALELLKTVLQPAGILVFVSVLIIFLLIGRVDVRDRALAVAGTARIAGSTRVLGEVGSRLGTYLFWLCVTNFTFALVMGILLSLLGIPYALTWATLTGLLRFVPFVGSPLSMLFPFLMAVVSQPGWFAPIAVAVVFGTLEFISNNFIEPWLIGRRIGLNTVGVILAILFWSWAWGATGLVLALPLTLTCVVFAKHIPGMIWLNTLLGIDPPLSDRDTLYQRLVTGDTAGAAKLLRTGDTAMEWAESMDNALAPALVLARNDHLAGSIDETEFSTAMETAGKVAEESQSSAAQEPVPQLRGDRKLVNVLAPADPADAGIPRIVVPFLAPWCDAVAAPEDQAPDAAVTAAFLHVVCILPRQSFDECFELCEQIHEQDPGGRIILLYWKPISRAWKLQKWIRSRAGTKVQLATGIARLAPMVRHFCERGVEPPRPHIQPFVDKPLIAQPSEVGIGT